MTIFERTVLAIEDLPERNKIERNGILLIHYGSQQNDFLVAYSQQDGPLWFQRVGQIERVYKDQKFDPMQIFDGIESEPS